MDDIVKKVVYNSLLAALICVATFIIKVPSVVVNGYTHLGDGFVFIAVLLLGRKNGAWAAAIGASLADVLGGYSHYAIPTFIIKGVMALIMGVIIEKFPNMKYNWAAGAFFGSIWQVTAYYLVGSFMIGSFVSTLIDIPANIIQSMAGILVTAAFIIVFKNSPIGKRLINR